MKKYIFSAISIVIILCIVFGCLCVLEYVETYNSIENGVYCENLCFEDTTSILESFEVSNMEFVNTEYIYYCETWREVYLVVKMILPYDKTEAFEENFSNNWMFLLETQEMDSFVDWWDVSDEEKFVALYTNNCLSEHPDKKCILLKYNKDDETIYYLYTGIYNKNVSDIVIRQVKHGTAVLEQSKDGSLS